MANVVDTRGGMILTGTGMEVGKRRLYDSPHPLPSGQISMPTYEYVCKSCGDTVEVFQSFSDKPLKRHEACGGDLQKVFHARGVVFKGSGFYSTDARASKGVSEPARKKKDTPTKESASEKAAAPSTSGSSSED